MTANAVTFGLYADPHYARRPAANGRTYANAPEKMQACYDLFRREGAAFAVCLGDLSDRPGDPEAGRRELDEIASLLRGQALPTLLVVGNHDVDTLPREELFARGGFRPEPYYSFDRAGFHFLLLDTNYAPDGHPFAPGEVVWDDTTIDRRQLEWLRCDLAAHKDKPAIVLAHANLDRFGGEETPDPHVIRNAAAVRAVLEGCPQPVTVFQGHYHPGRFSRERGIPYYTLKSLVGLPAGYYCMTVRADTGGNVLVTEWEG